MFCASKHIFGRLAPLRGATTLSTSSSTSTSLRPSFFPSRSLTRSRLFASIKDLYYYNNSPSSSSSSSFSSISSSPSPDDKDFVKIVEVGPRDGLQNEKTIVPLDTKISLIEKLSTTGLRVIEAGSFVAPKWVPQMADSTSILSHLLRSPPPSPQPVTYPFLVPNLKGLESALPRTTPPPPQAGASEISIFASASEGFSLKNLNCDIATSFERFQPVVKRALENNIKVRGYVSMVISCPYSGDTPPEKVVEVTKKLLEMGCYEVSLGDTTGVGNPYSIDVLMKALIEGGVPVEKLACHFHDTYGQAIVNCMVGLANGVRVFDSSVAGLGGCPYAKGATGNVATEDLVYFLHSVGMKTGVDLEKVSEVGAWISEAIGRKNNSKVGPALLAKKPETPASS
ncbi:hypothetical protein TWF788_004712 [Orbilia oligospora]|uniref:hydroxymethylglutaryl-CoA lyase n=1 Tax=Orbilia oligospora TaxID=2813651 RepID=A0A7C8P3B7_ORBOL|nr:hypothetical protein TWF788_004712 [Orbilia oligospora]